MLAVTRAPLTVGPPIFVSLPPASMSTSSSIDSPTFLLIDGTRTVAPCSTRNCLPPVFTIAYDICPCPLDGITRHGKVVYYRSRSCARQRAGSRSLRLLLQPVSRQKILHKTGRNIPRTKLRIIHDLQVQRDGSLYSFDYHRPQRASHARDGQLARARMDDDFGYHRIIELR